MKMQRNLLLHHSHVAQLLFSANQVILQLVIYVWHPLLFSLTKYRHCPRCQSHPCHHSRVNTPNPQLTSPTEHKHPTPIVHTPPCDKSLPSHHCNPHTSTLLRQWCYLIHCKTTCGESWKPSPHLVTYFFIQHLYLLLQSLAINHLNCSQVITKC